MSTQLNGIIVQNEATSSGTFMNDARVIWNETAYQAARQ